MPKRYDENLLGLHAAYDALVRSGDDSLRAAYHFGQIVDALSAIGYGYDVMGAEIDRSKATVYTYARLYRRYNNLDELLATARRYETFDIARLVGSDVSLANRFGYQCGNCGSWDTHRRPTAGLEAAR